MAETKDNNTATSAADASEIDRLNEELRREHDMYLRALADFENYRQRVVRERASATRSGMREMVLSLLELLDGFERAFQHIEGEPSAFSKGMQVIHRKLLALLESQGVTPIKSVGEPFNPELHEAIGSVQSDQHEPGSIVEELQPGYRWDEELLRPARVRVAQ
jgi:molecular chaperone GrpE